MPANPVAVLLRRLCGALTARPDTSADGVLLERFARQADEGAFAVLVQRHGPLVWGVSRRVARHEQDAEDVFQATFLLLARKAGAIRKGGSVASWLYGVAHRLALRVRTDAARRRQREEHAAALAPAAAPDDLTWRELREVLDEELARLPHKYRAALLLCYFEGLTQEEAARQLGWGQRVVKYRLERGRHLLRSRLARRGVTLPMVLAGPMLVGGLASAAPAALTNATLRAAVPFALARPLPSRLPDLSAGSTGPAEGVSAQAIALAEGGLKAMFIGKLQTLAAGLLAAVLLGSAVFLTASAAREAAPEPAPEQASPKERADRYGDALPPGALTRLGTVRYRFGGVGLAFLPDNQTVLSVRHPGTLAFWDARTGRLLREIDVSPLSMGQTFAFARDLKRIAVSGSLNDEAGWRNVVRVYDLASGKPVRTFERQRLDGSHALALSADGGLLFSIGRTGKLRVEEVATGAERLRQKFPGDVGASLALSPDGKTLALSSGPNSRKLFLWEWQGKEKPRELKTPAYRGESVMFSPDGKWLADCSDDRPTVRVWDVASGRLLHRLELPDHAYYWHRRAVFSPDGKVLAAAGRTNYTEAVHLWDPATGKFLRRLDLGGGALAYSPDGKLLAAGARVWDLAADRELSANDQAHRSAVERIVTGGDHLVVTASEDNTIRIWDAATGQHRRCLVHDGWIRDIALSPDGSRLASNSLDDTVSLWDIATGRKIYALAGHGQMGGRRAVGFAPDGKSFLAWGDDMYLRKWDVRTGKAVFEHPIRPTGIEVPGEDDEDRERGEKFLDLGDGRFTPDGKHMILQARGSFYVFDTATGKELRKFPGPGSHVIRMTISPDSKLVLASAWGTPVRVELGDGTVHHVSPKSHPVAWWDLTTGKQRQRLMLPEDGAGPVAFAPNGKFFAVASSRPGARIRVVEVATGREVRRIEGFRGVVRSLAFMPDGKRLVSGMEDSTALVWDLTR
ncbi:MAG: sigma-70 family RNA polymerase sigma factor [Gemmataceae bacterium]|nr:sigma-70 family RNA polymerase sigma factor [Gemmataceae bacterium]